MATIYNFHEELTALTAEDLANADLTVVYDTSTGITKKALLSDMAAYIRTFGGAAVNTTATVLAVTAPLHAGRIVTISSAAPIAITLPAATGTGNRYRFQFQVVATTTTSSITIGGYWRYHAGHGSGL